MNLIKKQILVVFSLIFSIFSCQTSQSDSLRGEFTYLLKYKSNTLNPDYITKELFSLQISNSRAFFISENKLKFDSAFSAEYNRNSSVIDMSRIPAAKSNFLIIQTTDNVQFYETVGMTLLSYHDPVINDWKLIDETKVINSIVCKKAETRFKGRDWTAWYSAEIPFPYGPYKFSGLPGLIIKITDKTEDYDFEMVKSIPSSKVRGRMVSVKKVRYQNTKLVTKKDLVQARTNFRNNAKRELESMGTVFSQDQKGQQKISETQKKGHNPIELED